MIRKNLIAMILAGIAYLLFWPVPVAPVAWDAPQDEGYVGVYAANERLAAAERVEIMGNHGPEDAALGPDGALYIATAEGNILRRGTDGAMSVWATTGGRPLGMEAAPGGGFYVADAYRGLLLVTAEKTTVLADRTSTGSPILYADDLDVAPDGAVWFSDASTKFGAEVSGGTLEGSYLELLEHGRTGRLLRWDPATGEAEVKLTGISFANGVAMGPDGLWLYFIETGEYALRRLWIAGPRTGEVEAVLENLPGFPDNINRDAEGGFLMGLVSKRAPLVDMLAGWPFVRSVVQRLPAALRPKAVSHGFVIHLDETGTVMETWQDPAGVYPLTTGAVRDADGALWITSLNATTIARLASP